MKKSVMYILTYCVRICPYMEEKYITNQRRIANNEFKRLSKDFYYVKMIKETTTQELIKQTKGTGHS